MDNSEYDKSNLSILKGHLLPNLLFGHISYLLFLLWGQFTHSRVILKGREYPLWQTCEMAAAHHYNDIT
jgi:hypothetical protein